MRSILLALAILGTTSLVACAAPSYSVDSRDRSRGAADEDEDDDSGKTKKSKSKSSELTEATDAPAAPTALNPDTRFAVSFKASDHAHDTDGDERIGRTCSDTGTTRTKASLVDATALELVEVSKPSVVLATLDNSNARGGKTLDAVRDGVAESGVIEFLVDHKTMPTTPTRFAIVGKGPGFGSPSQCAVSIDVTTRDSGQFGDGCGVLGYVEAHFDASAKEMVTKPKSQLVLGSNPEQDQGSSFGSTSDGCDFYDSPLVLDLGGKGITLGLARDGVFDVDGDGTADRLAWVTSAETPFLVRDANGNGVVDGIDEMFGNRTKSPLGLRDSANGFEALAAWDADRSGAIDVEDEVWSTLRLWFDENHDGQTDPGELVSLESRGIRSLSLGYVAVETTLLSSGEAAGKIWQRGAATAEGGRAVPVLDVWFRR